MMALADALRAAVGRNVRLAFVDGTETYCTVRSFDGTHALVRIRGDRHPTRVRISLLVGVLIDEDDAPPGAA